METGHYTAACKNPYDHQWYKFDDQRVSQVPADNIPDDIVNNEAYILFYQRRKVDTVECIGTSSASGDHWVSKITAVPSTINGSVSGRELTPVETKIQKVEIEMDAIQIRENVRNISIKFSNTKYIIIVILYKFVFVVLLRNQNH